MVLWHLAGGSSERASWVLDSCWWSSSSHMAKECQLAEFEAGCLLWKASGVHSIYQRDRGCLKQQRCMKEAYKVFSVTLGVLLSIWIFLWNWKHQQQHQNRMQTHSQTGSCANYYANYSRGTNAADLGMAFKISPYSNRHCDPTLNGRWIQWLTFASIRVLSLDTALYGQFHGTGAGCDVIVAQRWCHPFSQVSLGQSINQWVKCGRIVD